ncbi:phosphatidylinositol-4-kinase [Piedraia hortae CBS 480.64]|uniref:1-phosphatidylinositol 4-kinase n=1 Tax=Piedraia hortae CBS 480.64 TaxID=1314780 RepID=A0A6A7C812_9PEZI|nr:phosphatidylinositol-4-kinase [Piedraia hortae CBS 480.64]
MHALAARDVPRLFTPRERLEVVGTLRARLSVEFGERVDAAVAAVAGEEGREGRGWRRVGRFGVRSTNGPFGSMALEDAFMRFVEESVLLLANADGVEGFYQRLNSVEREAAIVEEFTAVVEEEVEFLEKRLQSRLALAVKAAALRTFLCCVLLREGMAGSELLNALLEATVLDHVQATDENLAATAFECMAILSRTSSTIAANLTRLLPRLIVQGSLTAKTAALAGEYLARVLKFLPQDTIISTLYKLGNVLSATENAERSLTFNRNLLVTNEATHRGSAISLVISNHDDSSAIHGAVAHAVVAIATAYRDEQVTALTIAMLIQKLNRVGPAVDAKILEEMAALGVSGGANELRSLLRLYHRVAREAVVNNDSLMTDAVTEGRLRLARWIGKASPLYEVYLSHLLGLCVGSGDAPGDRVIEKPLAAKLISGLFRPLATLLSFDQTQEPSFNSMEEISNLNRDAWFNIVIHGFTLTSPTARPHMEDLQTIAQKSLPLVSDHRIGQINSGIDLNIVLRRNASPQHTLELKSSLISTLPSCANDIKGLGYQECVFLTATLFVTNLGAQAGNCSAILPYLAGADVSTSAMSNCMFAIAQDNVDIYLQSALSGAKQEFSAAAIAAELAVFFEGCCHRIVKVQHVAYSSAYKIVTSFPSALCHKSSLFALLELLTLMWRSCLDAETNEYDWKSTYASEMAKVTIQVPDDVKFRQDTLAKFYQSCEAWLSRAIAMAPLDVKGLLQAYLEDYEDDGAYGQVALGRSFAVRMGSIIPSSDQRLTSIGRESTIGVNTASDFIAQYTTRQEYRHQNGRHTTGTEAAELTDLANRLKRGDAVAFPVVREVLRNAAAVLGEYPADEGLIIQGLVAVPFTIFSKRSIDLGVSLWLGIVKENPSLETRVLAEVAAGWETSIRLKKGFFKPHVHPDPFNVKEEFAPSKWDVIVKKAQAVHDLLAPHMRLTMYVSSHFYASRLTSPAIERIYIRLMRITMLAMKHAYAQPLAREVHFHMLLLALGVLRHSTCLDYPSMWRLRDAILSAGLKWFSTAPMWSFGSNKLQMKAEIRVMENVVSSLQSLGELGSRYEKHLPSLQSKQELLVHLLQHEIGRMTVWVYPLGTTSGGLSPLAADVSFISLLSTAWNENPAIVVQLATRFATSERLQEEVRRLVLNDTEKVIDEPVALKILLGQGLPPDVKTQLKYLLYWAPVSPITAVTYFLPAYGNHPLILQYAMRALESHAIDVTFFYVPQIVQTLRYDALDYVKRYIIETAHFSQLFAHQIIWNMKANAYKDEDSQVPDPVKPVLDAVMEAMISSWSDSERSFYQREFSFFNKVTSISGTLKPLIKRPKPEKKAKIEEELRKISVDPGVYLPSNPDGIVIGIDRQSGKPLQSHAKAPFMATFRIRKEDPEGLIPYEVWQSAIFKVGDDCRQDVLALQLISTFRGIFNSVGLDVYVFPYRVTATAPGCGVIDVLPNSVSRDMLGREAVNGLYEYFISKYGTEDSLAFQAARSNFTKSMAAYSIISYLLQFKDRHNGNIMLDDHGHILHIDFGFCFDIAPGGVRFERAPFKLTPEMVAVMGGKGSKTFEAFEGLCVKAFLAVRGHVGELVEVVQAMLDSGLPCFKPETIRHFRERFVLEKTEREAGEFVRKLVGWSERSYSTAVYDYFQLLTNGIPY